MEPTLTTITSIPWARSRSPNVAVTRRYEPHPSVLADPQQLKQVFLNLVLNSLEAMNGQGQLALQTTTHDGELAVTITDNGPGIPAKALPHIFEPFYTTKPTGTGLGLAVVQGIIKEHRGRVHVESKNGHGTSIRIYLPITV